tara:strand:- start:271 stop:1674 length:1404 start_codon:yes stop_codon:yes gene_type:complete
MINTQLHYSSFIEQLYKNSGHEIQSFLLSIYGFKKKLDFYSLNNQTALRILQRNDLHSKDLKDKFHFLFLRKLLNHVYKTVPYYKELFVNANIFPSDIKSLEDLNKIPILTKEQVRKKGTILKSSKFQTFSPKNYFTGGTTGKPLSFTIDNRNLILRSAEKYRHWLRNGYNFGDKMVVLRGMVIDYNHYSKKPWRFDYFQNTLYLSSYHMNSENLDSYIELLSEFKPDFLQAYPSTIFILARYMNEKKIKLSIKTIFTGSETLYAHYRYEIEKAFSCKVVDHYGHGEPGTWASGQCQCGNYILSEDLSIFEVVDKSGNEIRSGKGYLIETSLHNYSMPFIRYKTGDVVEITESKCQCGIQFKKVDKIIGREGDNLKINDKEVSGSMLLNQVLKKNKGIIEMQIKQVKDDELFLSIVPSNDYDSSVGKRLKEQIRKRIGQSINIEITEVQEIPTSPSGKKKYILNQIK